MFLKYFNVHSNGEQKHGGESTLRIPDHAIGAGDLVQPTPRPDRIPNTQLDTSFRIVERDRNSIRRKARLNVSSPYRVALVVEYLGWVDLNLSCSLGWWAAIVATYCSSRMVELPKS